MKKTEAYWPLILLLALIKFVLPIFLQSSVFELQRDEYLYYEQGQHVALGYLENPPILSWLGMISSWFGGSEAWIKFWPCLFGAATLVVTCLITAELGGGRVAQFFAGISIITGAFLRVHFLFQPNILDIFSWTLAVYFLIRYISTSASSNIYGLVISLALGWWGKYSVLFIAASILLALLATKHRTIFLKKQTWLAVGIGLLIILPNVWWQYEHNWPLIHHMNELRETQLQFLSPVDFLLDQLLMLLPVVLVWIAGLVWLVRQPQWRFLALIYLLVIILLIVGSGKSYYALGIYPMLLAAGGVAWERWTQKWKWIRVALTVCIVFFTWVILPLALPIWKPEKLAAFYEEKGFDHEWEDLKKHELPQDFADMLGWKELAERAERFYQTLPDSSQKATIIFCRNYGQAGSLKYFSKDNDFADKVISTNGSFLLWIPDDLTFDHLVLITHRMPDRDEEVFQHFGKVTVIDSVTNRLSRQYGDEIIFFQNIDTTGRRLVKEKLNEMKKQFGQ